MRIRSTKPEFWRSARIASVNWDARLVLKGLESYVDDNGVGKDDVALIVGDVFPRDMIASPRETVARVSEAISLLHQTGLVWRYEADSTRLLYISWWEEIQRIDKPGKGRFPRPDGTMDYKSSLIRESVASPRETVAPGTGEQGNRGTGKERETREPIAPPLLTIPDDWAPNLTHRAKAKQLGIKDLDSAAEAFRNHAIAQGRVLSNWDAGFASWLASPKTRAAERERTTTTPQSKLRSLAELAHETRQQETQQPKELA